MALSDSDGMSCGLTHRRHVDRLLISSSLIPQCPPQQRRRTVSNSAVDRSHVRRIYTVDQRFNRDDGLVEETARAGWALDGSYESTLLRVLIGYFPFLFFSKSL